MIRSRLHPENARLAIVEAGTLDELQEATGAHAHAHQDDPEWPFSAIVRADVVPRLPAKAAFVKRVAADLPEVVPLTLRRRLAGHAFDLASMPDRADSNSALASEARAIAEAAKRLTDRVDAWHRRAGSIAVDTRAARQELMRLEEGGSLTEEERRLALRGVDRYALRLVIIGLQVHLGHVAGRLSRPGAPRNSRDRAMVSAVVDAFDSKAQRSGKAKHFRSDSNQPGDWWAYSVMRDVCETLKRETGGTGNVEAMIKETRASRRKGRDDIRRSFGGDSGP